MRRLTNKKVSREHLMFMQEVETRKTWSKSNEAIDSVFEWKVDGHSKKCAWACVKKKERERERVRKKNYAFFALITSYFNELLPDLLFLKEGCNFANQKMRGKSRICPLIWFSRKVKKNCSRQMKKKPWNVKRLLPWLTVQVEP